MTTRGSLWRRASTVSGLLSQGPFSTGFAGLFGGIRDVAAKCATSVVRRFGWAFADQLLSSGTNFLLGVLVARTVDVRDLGAFSVAYATFTFSLGGVRAVASELLIIRHGALSEHEWRDGIKRSTGTALLAGIIIGAGSLIAGAILGGADGTELTRADYGVRSCILRHDRGPAGRFSSRGRVQWNGWPARKTCGGSRSRCRG